MANLLVELTDRTRGGPLPDPEVVGRKAVSIAWLAAEGVAVPSAFAVPASVVADLAGTATAEGALRAELEGRLRPGGGYAVRSSAQVEDGPDRSWAGQFETRLGCRGTDEVLEAIRQVGVSGLRGPAADYALARGGAAPAAASTPVSMAVVVQEMAEAVASGVVFSRNPVTGLDEVVVEAVPGPGSSLVAGGVTPDRWIHRWGAFIEAPVSPRVATPAPETVVAVARRLAARAGHPLDLEWAHDGRRLWWLQARPMTGLDGIRIYSNRIAREVLPGIVKPLVWSVNVPLVNGAWLELLEELVGPTGIEPERLARSFAGRAYFDMSTLGDIFAVLGMPRDSLELLVGLPRGPERPRMAPTRETWRHVPRMVRFGGRLLRHGRRVRSELPELSDACRSLEAVNLDALDEPGLLAHAEKVIGVTRRAAYLNILTPLLMLAYGKGLDRLLASAGIDARVVDPTAGRPDRLWFSPGPAMDRVRDEVARLPGEPRRALEVEGLHALRGRADLAPVRAAFDDLVARFGYLSASGNDLSAPSWRETEGDLLRMVLDHPPARAAAGALDWAAVRARIPAAKRPLASLAWRRAGAFRVYREAVGAVYTRGYRLLRPTFLELGGRLAARGVLARPDDVHYLALDELRALVAAGPAAEPPSELVARRRAELEAAATATLPDLIVGEDYTPGPPSAGEPLLRGLGVSRGRYRGPGRVVREHGEFGRVREGDVLVIPFSDVSWTPLFARAGAVVAEAGGMLAHAAIIAREYGIPCVVSASGACTAIADGQLVSVDGYEGTVTVEVPATAPEPES